MADTKVYHGVYLADGDGYPVALFEDADAAQRYRMTLPTGGAGLVAEGESVSVGRSESVADHFKALAEVATEAAPAVADPDATLRGEIRAQLEFDARRTRLTEEVKRDMAKEDRAGKADSAPAHSAAR